MPTQARPLPTSTEGGAAAAHQAGILSADAGELAQMAAAGDEHAWAGLVNRFTPMLWAIARSYRLPTPDAADVVQVAWLRLLQHLPRVRQPHLVGAWLATTVRRECLTTIRRRDRERPCDLDETRLPADNCGGDVDEGVLRAERDALLHRAVRQLPPRQQLLLRLLTAEPPPSYREISAATGIPIGSIGPTRARALQRLRGLLAHEGMLSG